MNKTGAVTEVLDEMRDRIYEEILSAVRALERLGVPQVRVGSLLAVQMLDILMDIFPDYFPELERRKDELHLREEAYARQRLIRLATAAGKEVT